MRVLLVRISALSADSGIWQVFKLLRLKRIFRSPDARHTFIDLLMIAANPSQCFKLAVILEDPVPGVLYALQRRDGSLDEPTEVYPYQLRFEALVRLGASLPDGRPNLLGEFVSGSPSDRFIYINSGQRAGQTDSCWDRRAKVKLSSLSPELIRAALTVSTNVIEGRTRGSALDGGPCCATVRLDASGWVLAGEH